MARPPQSSTHNGDAAVAAADLPATRPLSGSGLSLSLLADAIGSVREQVVESWVRAQLDSTAYRRGYVSEGDMRSESEAIVVGLHRALGAGDSDDLNGPAFGELVRLLHSLSKHRAHQGYTPTDTASSLFSLRGAITEAIEGRFSGSTEDLAAAMKTTNAVVDRLGLVTFEAFVVGRDEVIGSQQQALLELSTPVVKLWDGIVAVPLIGTLDSGRTQTVMENLLQSIAETESQVAIIDITGVSVVDTLVAQHLLKTVAATRLMGSDCIISGVRPQIAQTMVHLGIDLSEVVTKSTLADAFRAALRLIGADPSAVAR